MLIGGVAVGYYGFPRFTPFIDMMVKLSLKDTQKLIFHMKNGGYNICKEEVLTLVQVGNRFVADFNHCEINFWIAKYKLAQDMLKRRRRVSISGRCVWICSPEDLILMELKEGGELNHNDILSVLVRQKKNLKMENLICQTQEFFEFENKSTKLKELATKAKEYGAWSIRKHFY